VDPLAATPLLLLLREAGRRCRTRSRSQLAVVIQDGNPSCRKISVNAGSFVNFESRTALTGHTIEDTLDLRSPHRQTGISLC
jgi:hypothetical protein